MSLHVTAPVRYPKATSPAYICKVSFNQPLPQLKTNLRHIIMPLYITYTYIMRDSCLYIRTYSLSVQWNVVVKAVPPTVLICQYFYDLLLKYWRISKWSAETECIDTTEFAPKYWNGGGFIHVLVARGTVKGNKHTNGHVARLTRPCRWCMASAGLTSLVPRLPVHSVHSCI